MEPIHIQIRRDLRLTKAVNFLRRRRGIIQFYGNQVFTPGHLEENNLKTGARSTVSGIWGEETWFAGINKI